MKAAPRPWERKETTARYINSDTLAGLTGCKGRPDCLDGFQSGYGIQFKAVNFLDAAPLRYSALENGQADAIEVFTTDGPIRANHLVVLVDNKHAVLPAGAVAVSALAVPADIFLRLVDRVLPASRAGVTR